MFSLDVADAGGLALLLAIGLQPQKEENEQAVTVRNQNHTYIPVLFLFAGWVAESSLSVRFLPLALSQTMTRYQRRELFSV